MSFEELPRELIVKLMKMSDMETRIKARIIHRLVISDDLSRKIKANLEQRIQLFETNMVVIPIDDRKQYECYYDEEYERHFWYFSFATCNNFIETYSYPNIELLYPTLKTFIGYA